MEQASQSDIFAQIRYNSLADLAYESIFELILTRRLPSGSEVTTAGLAQQLDISRTPITEALQRLVADGIVIWPKGRRARVASFDQDDISQIFQVRLALESLSAELAAQHMPIDLGSEILNESKGLLEHTDADDWSSQCIALDIRFHQLIAEHSQNCWLEKDIQRMHRLMRVMFGFTASVERICQALREHIPVLEAINNRDAAGARAAMAHHIEISGRVMLETYAASVAVGDESA